MNCDEASQVLPRICFVFIMIDKKDFVNHFLVSKTVSSETPITKQKALIRDNLIRNESSRPHGRRELTERERTIKAPRYHPNVKGQYGNGLTIRMCLEYNTFTIFFINIYH